MSDINKLKGEIIKTLKTCYDPEMPVDIYELGLIYDIKISDKAEVTIVMTLTSPACPVAEALPLEVEEKIEALPMIKDVKVDITFDPPWSPDNMSEVAKLELGFL